MPPKALQLKTPHLGLFIARRNSGKTRLMKHLLSRIAPAFRWVKVCSPTIFNGEWPGVVGEENCWPLLDEEWLDDLLLRQASLKERGVNNPGLLILDDCLGAARWSSAVITRLATAGRHYGVTIWASFQTYAAGNPILRQNADYTFILGQHTAQTYKALYEDQGPRGFPDEKAWAEHCRRATANYGALVVEAGGNCAVVRAPARERPLRILQ